MQLFFQTVIRGIHHAAVLVQNEERTASKAPHGDGGEIILRKRILISKQRPDRRECIIQPVRDNKVERSIKRADQQRTQDKIGNAGAQETLTQQLISLQFCSPTP